VSGSNPRVVLDACVLFPALLRDTLLRVAEAGLYEARWSLEILDEVQRNLVATGRVTQERARHLLDAMTRAFPEALVTGWEAALPETRNHPKDRHVVAAAIKARAQYVVTNNLRDFRQRDMPPRIMAASPDLLLVSLLQERPRELLELLRRQAAGHIRRPISLQQLILGLDRAGLSTFAGVAAEALWVEIHGERPKLPDEVRAKLDQLRARGKAATPAEQLDAYRAVRAARVLPPEAAMFLIAVTLDDEFFLDALGEVPELKPVDEQLRKLEKAYGLKDDEYWPIGEAPEEIEKVRAEWEAVAERAKIAFFRSRGESELATLMEREPALYEQLLEVGRRYFHGGEHLSVLLQ